MYTKTLTYDNFLGQKITKTFYFNISSAEFLQKSVDENDAVFDLMQKLQQNLNQTEQGQIALKVISKLIELGYGEVSDDGESFVKVDNNGVLLYKKFVGTIAFDKVFMELITNNEEATKFIQNVLPVEELQKLSNANNIQNLQMPVSGALPFKQ